MSKEKQIKTCPFCGSICEGSRYINLICKCGAKYYYESDIWFDRKKTKRKSREICGGNRFMNKDKQIEEMADVYYKARLKARDTLGSMNEGAEMWYAKAFYEAGYRKQSEWISVEEKLPEENGYYLVYTKYGYIEVERYKTWDDDDLDGGYWWEFEGRVTHWMPLPDAPKGGAE